MIKPTFVFIFSNSYSSSLCLSDSISNMDEDLPPGWIRESINGRIVFFTPAPFRVKIDCNATLKHQHKRGKFLNVTCLNFKRKKLVKQVDKRVLYPTPKLPNKEMSKNEEKINSDLEKMSWAVSQLSIDAHNSVNHRKELEDVAKLLNKCRISLSSDSVAPVSEFDSLKAELISCKSMEEIVAKLAESPYIRGQFSRMEKSSMLEEMFSLGRSYNKGPLNSFPPNVNRNLYADLVSFELENAPKIINLLVDLHTDRDKCISPENVIKIGFSFSQLAVGVNEKLSVWD